MSRYGLTRYNLGYYGSTDANPFIATNFTATEQGYGYIRLDWNSPYGQWSKIKLVRNSYGFPVDAFDGIPLDIKGDNSYIAFKETDPTYFVDSATLGDNAFYYYSLFVFETVTYTWVRVGDTLAVSAKDYGYTDNMYNSLPEIYRATSLGEPFDRYDNDDLYEFLSLFGFQLSLMHTYTNLLVNRYKVDTVGGNLVPPLMQEFGLEYEQEIGLQQERILLQNVATILKEKGSADGLNEYLKAYTGYTIPGVSTAPNPNVTGTSISKNLMLDYNDSSFEESVGHWASPDSSANIYCLKQKDVTKLQLTSNVATLTIGTHDYKVGQKIYTDNFELPLFNSGVSTFTLTAVASTTVSFALTATDVPLTFAYNEALEIYPTISPDPFPWPESTALVNYPNKQKGILAVRNAGTSTATLKVHCGASNAITKGIPVAASTVYSFSVYAIAGSTTRTITAGIDWYDRFGVYISSSTGTGTANATGQFSGRISATNKTSPATAYYAVPTLSIASSAGSASNEWHYFDCAQLEQSASVTAFEEARQIKVILKAKRINELVNPHFDGVSSATPWVTTGGTDVVSTARISPEVTTYPATYLTLVSGVATLESSLTNDLKVSQVIYVSGVTGVTNGNYTVTEWGAATSTAGAYVKFNTGGSTTAARTAVTGYFYDAGNCLEVTASGTSAVVSSWDGSTTAQLMDIHYPSTDYTFSVYCQGTTVTDTATAAIKWYNASYSLLSTSTGTAVPLTTYATPTAWDRVSVTGTAPATAAYAAVQITFATTSTNVLALDSALFERASYVEPFFDGGGGPGQSTDFMWEGTANASRSHYYKNYAVVSSRLRYGALDDYLLLGTTLALYYAQPNT
jgi:hypothetical protein